MDDSPQCKTFNLCRGELKQSNDFRSRTMPKSLSSDVMEKTPTGPSAMRPEILKTLEKITISQIAHSLAKQPAFTQWASRAASKNWRKYTADEFTERFMRLTKRFHDEMYNVASNDVERHVASSIQARKFLLLSMFRDSAESPQGVSEVKPVCSTEGEDLQGYINIALSFLRAKSAVIDKFAVAIRESLYYDTDPQAKFSAIKATVKEAVGNAGQASEFCATFMVDWELPEFMAEEMDNSSDVGPVLTLSGSAVFGDAVQCLAYLENEKLWPCKTGPVILGCIEEALVLKPHKAGT
jgi:hypothetical protein